MNKSYFIFFLILVIPFVLGACNTGQIDINSASKKELEKLYGIGEVKSQAIIDSRPFNSIDDLIKVYGIGEITLKKIKEQGLACVNTDSYSESNKKENIKNEEDNQKEENNKDEEEEEDSLKEESKKQKVYINTNYEEENNKSQENYSINKEKITLFNIQENTKDIKISNNKENVNKGNYSIFLIITFGILLLFLFILKKYFKSKKNEFK